MIHMNRVKPLSTYTGRDMGLLFDKMEGADPESLSMCEPKASVTISFGNGEEALLLTEEDLGQPVVSLPGSPGDLPDSTLFAMASFALVSIKKEFSDAETLLLRDARIMQCLRKNLGDVVTVIPAIAGDKSGSKK